MSATERTVNPATDATAPRINFEVFDVKCAALGALDDPAQAELVGIDRTTLWRWRNDKQKPSATAILRIAERLGVSVEELVGRAA